MADEQTHSTHSRERRLVMPEHGSRYQPRRVPPRSVDGFRSSTSAPRHEHTAPAQKPSVAHVVKTAPSSPGVVGEIVAPRHKKVRRVAATKPALPRQHRSLVLKRNIDAKAEKYQKQVRRERWQQVKAFLFGTVIATVVAVFAVAFVMVRVRTVPSAEEQAATPATLGIKTDSVGSDESPVTIEAVNTYKVAPTEPRVLRIARLGIQARIKPVTASAAGEPAATSNIHDVGWLQTSSKPGMNGVMVMNGSIAGTSEPGAFHEASSLVPGDVIQIERGDGVLSSYVVSHVKSYPSDKVDLQQLTASSNGRPTLNILTNTGRFNVRTNQFEDRVLVQAYLQ